MKPELIVIDSLAGINELYSYLSDKDVVSFDTETAGLTQRDQVIGFSVCAEESKAYYIILAKWKTNPNTLEQVPGIEYHAVAYTLLKDLKNKSLVMHNGVFDCMMVESNLKLSLINSLHTDTMILAHLLDENRRVGLKELGTKMYGADASAEAVAMKASILANGGLVTNGNYELYKADPKLIGVYGAKDAWLTFKLFQDLVPELVDQGLADFFYDESMPLLRGPTYDLNITGLQVNTVALQALKSTLKAECAEAKAFILKEIHEHTKDIWPGTTKANTFNLGSNQQLSRLLFGLYGLDFSKLTKGGKDVCKTLGLKLPYAPAARRNFLSICQQKKDYIYQPEGKINGKVVKAKKVRDVWCYVACDKETIKKVAHKYKWIEKLLEYQTKMKLLSTYVEGIEERIQHGVMRSSYLQHGTMTGRYASRNPNLQNLPRNDQRVKNCFMSRPGKVFVSADFSQLEPRVFASYSKDPRLMSAFDGTSDFYSVTGMDVYDKSDCTPQKDGSPNAFGVKYKSLRDDAKTFTLATAYGATPAQLASKLGKSIDDTAALMVRYFERFPGVRKMMLEAHELAKDNGFVTNIFGRKRRIPEAKRIVKLFGNKEHWDLPYDARKLLNMSCNFRIQSTAASIVNRSAIAFYEACQTAEIDCRLVSQIHDELVVECDIMDAEDVAILLQSSMEGTVELPGVTLEAIPRITKTLAK